MLNIKYIFLTKLLVVGSLMVLISCEVGSRNLSYQDKSEVVGPMLDKGLLGREKLVKQEEELMIAPCKRMKYSSLR